MTLPEPRSRGLAVDRVVRQSWLGRRIGWLRKASPGTYVRLRAAYRKLIGVGEGNGLSAYQRRAIDKFVGLAGRGLLEAGVLEIGSDLDGAVLRELRTRGARRVVGINPAFSEVAIEAFNSEMSDGTRLFGDDIRSSGLPSASFGGIFSVAVLEHLLDLDLCLAEMHRLLVPGGLVYAAFGPIWGSSLGHHVFADVDGVQLRHWDPRLNPIEDHGHLMLTSEAMRTRVERVCSTTVAATAVDWIYRSDSLNRLFYEDYVAAFERSAFKVLQLVPEREHVPASRLWRLAELHPGYRAFDVRNAEVVLQKSQ